MVKNMKVDLLSHDAPPGARWGRVHNVPGWGAFSVEAMVAQVDGEPRVVGLHLNPKEGAKVANVLITRDRVRRLPVTMLAEAVTAAWALFDSPGSIRERMTVQGPVARVAHVYNQARQQGKRAPQAEVEKALGLSKRTATRRIKEAREQGLITRSSRERGA